MHPKDRDVIVNGLGPLNTVSVAVARSGSALFTQTCLSKHLEFYGNAFCLASAVES